MGDLAGCGMSQSYAATARSATPIPVNSISTLSRKSRDEIRSSEGVVDIAPPVSFRGAFEPLRDPEYFAQVRVDTEPGSVAWPNGADLDPDVLYGLLAESAGAVA